MLQFEKINTVLVIGGGVMGPGIALSYARGGYTVRLADISETALETSKRAIEGHLETMAEVGEIETEGKAQISERVSYLADIKKAAEGVGFIAEAITERKDAKKALYEHLDTFLPEEAIIASNTSFLNIFELMPARRQPYAVISHWYDPPHIIPLVEVVRGPETEECVMAITAQMLERCKKVALRMEKFTPGFFVNLVQKALGDVANYLVDNDFCTPEQFDVAIKSSVYPRGVVLGYFQKADFSGIHTYGTVVMENGAEDAAKTLMGHYHRGEYGVRAGKGFFDYTGRDIDGIFKERDRRLYEVMKIAMENINNKL
ncbi:MAG: 3-hydroxyacyl-CoA dehydrogenase family protein [Clostridiales Family XIII bacterium]|jgi:3-hydroxybutyryl-CoA dehydrogenase|nr:3-hydroxyacyl-CoA dehydrogenase family protein [Clostridiales Family XIII bacterium]